VEGTGELEGDLESTGELEGDREGAFDTALYGDAVAVVDGIGAEVD
jgi:hypothetical protein